jgi:hypothetical protein
MNDNSGVSKEETWSDAPVWHYNVPQQFIGAADGVPKISVDEKVTPINYLVMFNRSVLRCSAAHAEWVRHEQQPGLEILPGVPHVSYESHVCTCEKTVAIGLGCIAKMSLLASSYTSHTSSACSRCDVLTACHYIRRSWLLQLLFDVHTRCHIVGHGQEDLLQCHVLHMVHRVGQTGRRQPSHRTM